GGRLKIASYGELRIIHRQRIEVGVAAEAGEVYQVKDHAFGFGGAEVFGDVAAVVLEDDLHAWVGGGLNQVVCFGEDVIDRVEQDVLVLFIAVDVVQPAEVHRKEHRLAVAMFF